MEITKLIKTINLQADKLTLNIEIEIPKSDLENFDYYGLDMIPDEMIPDVLLTVSRMYTTKNGKLKKVVV